MAVEYERRSITKDEERDIITGMIVSTDYLLRIKDICKPSFFTLPYAKIVSGWCIEYYEKYEEAPFKNIGPLFESKKVVVRDEATIETIDLFLSDISSKFSGEAIYNVEYHIDKAIAFFKTRSLDLLVEKIKAAQLNGDYEKAERDIATFQRVEKLEHAGIDLWEDVDTAVRSLESWDKDNYLLRFPGALGELVRPFRRQEFIAFFGPAKRGKSWWLMEVALLAAFNKLNVLYFSLEMTEDQMWIRILMRLMGQLSPGDDESCEVDFPVFDPNYSMTGKVNIKKMVKKTLERDSVIRKLRSMQTITKMKRFKLMCMPSGSIKASDILVHLDNLEHYDDFIPDVICVDYADILGPERNNDKRHQIDETWRILRQISEQRSCLVATVSHTGKATFNRNIRQDDASEDIRKMNHITWGGGLNQSDEDIDNRISRISIIADRFKMFNKSHEVAVLQCLDIGQCYIDSRIAFNSDKK